MVNLCNEANPLDSRFGILATKIRNILSRFVDCKLSFIRRENNVPPAHLFARHALLVQVIVTCNEILNFANQVIWLDSHCSSCN